MGTELVYGQLYKLESELKSPIPRLENIPLNNKLIIINLVNRDEVLKHGELASISRYYREYLLELYTRRVLSLSRGTTANMNTILKNLIDKKIKIDSEEMVDDLCVYAQKLSEMKSISRKKKLVRGTFVCNPELDIDTQYLVYLGGEKWLKVYIDLTNKRLPWHPLEMIRYMAVNDIKKMNKEDIIQLPFEKVTHKGVQLDILEV